ncbi:vomeronasal type-2 receptor 1-like [Lithobates pipiens]
MPGKWLLLKAIACFGILILTQKNTGLLCFIRKIYSVFNTKYFQDGDIIIGGIFTVNRYYDGDGFRHSCYLPIPHYYRYMLTFIFAIDEINKNPNILPNVTLGYHMHDSCNDVSKAVQSVLQILSGSGDTVPNYSCRDRDKLAGVIGDHTSESSLHVFDILNIYGYTQISYGATDPLLTNKHLYPSFFQTLPSDQTQYLAIAKLLAHFGWTWIGVITSRDDSGEKRSQELKRKVAVYDICVEYIIYIAPDRNVEGQETELKNIERFNKSTSKIVVLCSISLATILFFGQACNGHHDKTLIVPAGPILHILLATKFKTSFHGSLVFSPSAKNIPNLKTFLDNISTSNHPNDLLQEHILAIYFKCLTSDPLFNLEIENSYTITLHPCNSSVKLSQLGNTLYNTEKFGTAYQVYKTVYAVAHSLHGIQLYMSRYPGNSYLRSYMGIKKVTEPLCL